MQLLTGRVVGRLAAAGLLGVVVGVVGTGVHRLQPPLGLVLALVTVVCAAVLVRAWTGWAGMLALAMGLFTAVSVLANRGPGGDVLIALDGVGVAWYAGALAVLVAAVLPRRWFRDEPS